MDIKSDESGLRVPNWYFQHLRGMDVEQYIKRYTYRDRSVTDPTLRIQMAVLLKLFEFPDIAAHIVRFKDGVMTAHLVVTDTNHENIDLASREDILTRYVQDELGVKGTSAQVELFDPYEDDPHLKSTEAIVDDMLQNASGRPVPATIGRHYLLSLKHDTDESLMSLFEKLEERINNETEEHS